MKKIKQVSEVKWELPISYKKGMRVPGLLYATKKLLEQMEDRVFEQLANVASLPGIVNYAFCMPDAHSGYGFPIGGVAAFDPKNNGVISPGGIGFDIGCGMRLIRSNLTIKEVKPKFKQLVDLLFKMVPAGVGRKGFVKISKDEFAEVVTKGVNWCIDNGYGWKEDLEHIEENGCIKNADASKVSDRAKNRGIHQLGTLGSGNHYLEIQVVKEENIHQPEIAKKFGIDKNDQIVIMIHCGSRGFGHQIGTDYLKKFLEVMPKYGIEILDRELACAPFNSPEGQDYFKAMACGANLAMANRQVITHQIREAFRKIFQKDPKDMDMSVIYDISHNIAKLENWNGKELIVHRKGSTRCFGPSRKEMTGIYKETGQPVIVGGSMETGSYLLVGTDESFQTWGSTMHGSGRTMSRTKARKLVKGEELLKNMEKKGIYVRTVSFKGVSEEAGIAYKDLNEVVNTMEIAGVTKKVVLLKPIGNVKG